MDEQNNTPPELRELLTQVASGAVDPAEAARRLSGGTASSADPTSGASSDTAGASPSGEPRSGVRVVPGPAAGEPSGSEVPIDRVVIRATASKLVLLGEEGLTGAAVEGQHVARRDGGALVIDTDAEPADGDFAFESSTSRFTRKIGRWR